MIITLKEVVQMFRAFKDAHLQINDFGYGPVSDISTATEMEFPYMWVTHTQPSVINYKRHSQIPSWNFSFLFLDQINQQTNHSEENGLNTDNQEDIMSDQFQIFNILRNVKRLWCYVGRTNY